MKIAEIKKKFPEIKTKYLNLGISIFIAIISFVIGGKPATAAMADKIKGSLTKLGKYSGYIPADGTAPQPHQVMGSYIAGLLALMGFLFLILMIWGGVTWMTAAGNEEKVAKAKKIIKSGVIGLMIIICSLIITNLVISGIEQAVFGTEE